MRRKTRFQLCFAVCFAIASSSKAQVVNGSEVYANGWFRNNTAGTGLFNMVTGTGIYSPSTGMMATYNNGNFTANSVYSNDWFRNNNSGTGMFNMANATGIYSPAYGMMATYNNGGLIVGNVSSLPAGYKLYVSQGILTEKIKVAIVGSANWADYVFAKDYQLMPLAQVEQYIKANQHLPNVPSAADMVKEGNDLGKTTAKLLEKIEELTLYMIDLKKANDGMLKKINQQDTQITKLQQALAEYKKSQ